MSLCYFRLLISLLRLPLEYISSFLHELKIYLYFVLIVYKVVDPCLNWYIFFYVLFRDKTLLGVSIDTKHNTPTEVVFCFSCVTGTFLGVCMVVAYVYYRFITTDTVSTGIVSHQENRGRNRYNVEMFLCAYYISAGQTSLLQVQ